jgi:hypothetical protein
MPIVAVTIVIVVVLAGFSLYYFSVGSNANTQQQKYTCSYQPGGGFYLQVLSDTTSTSLPGLAVSGQLVSGCPILTSCSGQPGGGVPSCPSIFPTISYLGKWSFVTNGTGYVYVPGSDLGGSAFWFNLTYSGRSYLAKSQMCNGGVTFMQLSLPSGVISAHEVPANSGGVNAGQEPNGVQTIQGCDPVTSSGIATIS